MWKGLTARSTVRTAGIALGIGVVFSLGVLIGRGQLQLVHAPYASRTGLPAAIDYSSLNQLYDALRQNYNGKLTEQQVLDGLKRGLAGAANDPYTEYFTAQEAKDFNTQLDGQSLTGIGAQLDKDKDGNVVVMSPLPGSPAEAAGLRAKDIIMAVDGQSTAGLSVNQAVQKIRGPAGSKVELGIVRGGTKQLTFTITRAQITVPTATSKVLDNGVGYLQISQFGDNTYDLVQQEVAKLKAAGVSKLVLDLRDNPGGEVTSAQNIASLWLRSGDLIMQEKRGNTVVDSYRANGTNTLQGMPTVVLVNNGSASAAEILALALRDHKAATIIGEKSYGKGVVQQMIPFSDGSELKVTIAQWYSPNGTSINHQGITPDQTVTISDADAAAAKDTQLQAAQDYLNK